MGRGGAAAPPDNADARLEHTAPVDAKVLGRGHVHQALVQVARLAGVRGGHHRGAAGLDHLHGDLVHVGRPVAVDAHHVGPPLCEHLRHALRRCPILQATVREAHLRNDRPREQRPGYFQRQAHLLQVAERLEEQQIHLTLHEHLNLLPERCFDSLGGLVAQVAHGLPRRPHRPREVYCLARFLNGLSGNPHASLIHRDHLVPDAVLAQEERVGRERVRLDNICPRRNVLLVHRKHLFRTR
mmetsp:Transcript_10494/g.29422  ORF Transcript_10494/g.29422 Transcript_10494/m.29422 type:complete len:241 (+) Transcript_10494:1169-1891(+)